MAGLNRAQHLEALHTMVMAHLVTTSVRSTTEGYIFTGVRLFRGVVAQSQVSGPRSFPGGVPHPLITCPFWGVPQPLPCSFLGRGGGGVPQSCPARDWLLYASKPLNIYYFFKQDVTK